MLPEPQVPFPVSLDHRVRPDLVRLDEDPFTPDKLYPSYQSAKEQLIREPWTSLWARDTDFDFDSNPIEVIHALIYLIEQASTAYAFSEEIQHRLRGPKPFSRPRHAVHYYGKTLARYIQEDFVLMRGNKAEAMWVCLPSRWNPAEKIGLDFAQIHAPIPHNGALQSAQHNVAKAMREKGPFVRHVWGLTHDPNLCQHPSLPRWEQGETLYFRTERQVTLPIPELERSWFLIRVYNVPLQEVLTTPERKELLAEALRTMPPEHIAYKHMEQLISRALEMCRD